MASAVQVNQTPPHVIRAEVLGRIGGGSLLSDDNAEENSMGYYDAMSTTSFPAPASSADHIIIGGNTSHALLDYTSNHTLCDFTHLLYTTTYPISSKFLLWFCVLCIIIIVVLNGLVLVVLTVYWPAVRRLRNANSMRAPGREAGRAQQELYIANLAFCDFFIGLFLFPLWLLETVVYGCWTFPQWACRWRKILSWVLGFESGVTVGLIALDRFMMVRLGPMYSQRETRTRVCLKIVCSWMLDIAFFVPLSYYDKFTDHAMSINGFCFSEFYQNWQLFWCVYYIYYAVPVGFCVGIYVALFFILKHRRRAESVKRNSTVLAASSTVQHTTLQNNVPLLTLTVNGRAADSCTAVDDGNIRRTTTTSTRILHPPNNNHQQRNMYADPFKRRYRKAWVTMIFLNAVFAMWWLPFWLVSLVELSLKSLAEPAQQTRASFVLHDIKIGIEVIYYLNSLLNPCIYLTTIPSLRLAAYKILKKLMCCQFWPFVPRRDRASSMLATDVPSGYVAASPSALHRAAPSEIVDGDGQNIVCGYDNNDDDTKGIHNYLLTETLLDDASPQRTPRRYSLGKRNAIGTKVSSGIAARRSTLSGMAAAAGGGKSRYLSVCFNAAYASGSGGSGGNNTTSTSDHSPVSVLSLTDEDFNGADNRRTSARSANRKRSGSENVGCVATTEV